MLDCLGERSLDFEEISDEELEEEARVSKGIVDVLGADWAGLVQETRPRPKRVEGPGSAHRRWMMDRIIARLGISIKYAGKDFADKLMKKQKDVEEQDGKIYRIHFFLQLLIALLFISAKENFKFEIKKEMDESMENGEKSNQQHLTMNVSVKMENGQASNPEKEKKPQQFGIVLVHNVPALHSSIREYENAQSCLFVSHNRFKRALSARTDLSIR